MAKRRIKKTVKKVVKKKAVKKLPKKIDSVERMRATLAKRTKEELIDALMEFARDDRRFLRKLDERFEPDIAREEIVRLTEIAIDDATDFDKRYINYNFDYDSEAYNEIQRNLSSLVGMGEFRPAMKLCLKLMQDGCCQVEMSDEGLMSDDIEACFEVVVNALRKSKISADEVIAWCNEMLKRDCMEFIYNKELKELREYFKSS